MSNQLKNFFRRPGVLPAAVGIASFGAGAYVGYLFGRRQVVEIVPAEPCAPKVIIEEEDYEELTTNTPLIAEDDPEFQRLLAEEEEIEARQREERAIETVLIQEGTLPPGDIIIDDGFPTYPSGKPNPADITVDEDALAKQRMREEMEHRNVFSPPDTVVEGWDYEEEAKTRSERKPYILHKDEFWAEEKGYEQTTLTYYVGDDILTDQNDVPIYNHEAIVGELKFGHGSGDPNVVHIRNDQLESEYEIIRDSGHYAIVILGLEAEAAAAKGDLKHSNQRKFRLDE